MSFVRGLCLYINEDILSNQIHTKLVKGLESTCIEMNLTEAEMVSNRYL